MRRIVRDNGLGLAFGGLFLATLIGQAFAGLAQFNEQQVAQGAEPVSLLDYLTSSSFAVDVVENWQSEYLQFFLYVFATVWLIQRGSPESKKLDQVGPESDEDQRVGPHADDDSPAWARVGGWRTLVFSRSLGLVMGVIFLLCWGCAVDRRMGGVQQRATRPAPGPGQLGRLPRRARFLEPHLPELAVRDARGRVDGRAQRLPPPARIPRVQARRSGARRHRTDGVSSARRAHDEHRRERGNTYDAAATPPNGYRCRSDEAQTKRTCRVSMT